MRTKRYYEIAAEASKKIDGHPGLMKLREWCKKAEKILDVGCGEGSRLNVMGGGMGVDINHFAISQAKKKYPESDFQIASVEKLPFADKSFDLVYSAFVIEHVKSPEKMLEEMIRVTSKRLVIICPNYGSPNRRSPVSTENPMSKLIRGLFWRPNSNILGWIKVIPRKKYVNIDDDTTVEPYLLSLKRYLENKGLKIEECSSLWELEPPTLNPRKLFFKIFFEYCGPQIFLSARI